MTPKYFILGDINIRILFSFSTILWFNGFLGGLKIINSGFVTLIRARNNRRQPEISGRILVLSGRFSNLPAIIYYTGRHVLKQVRKVAGRLKKVISGPEVTTK